MASARIAAVATWVYAAGFGLPTIPIGFYLWQRGTLPYFGDLFQMYGGPWSAEYSSDRMMVLLLAFLVATAAASWSAWWLWQRRRVGAVLNLALLPLEAIFWWGFALPIPWLVGVVRIVAVAGAWPSLSAKFGAHSRQA